jgi:Fur family peroxide stress response transcriptional regulator
MFSQSDLKELFKRRRMPLTHQRLAVYGELACRRDHPGAEALYDSLRRRVPGLALATVYKTLKTLHEMGLIIRIDSPASQARYDADVAAHHHAVCTACGRIADVRDERLDRLPRPAVRGFLVRSCSVNFRGLCAECAKAPGSRAASKSRNRRHHNG